MFFLLSGCYSWNFIKPSEPITSFHAVCGDSARSESSFWDEHFQVWGDYHEEKAIPALTEWKEFYSKGSKAIELAGGTGSNSLELARLGLEVILVDFSLGALRIAQGRAWKRGLRIDFVHDDLNEYPVQKKCADLLLSVSFFHEKIMDRFLEMVKINGFFIFDVEKKDIKTLLKWSKSKKLMKIKEKNWHPSQATQRKSFLFQKIN